MRNFAVATVGLIVIGALLGPSGVAGQSGSAGRSGTVEQSGADSRSTETAPSARERLQGAWQVVELGNATGARPGPEWWSPPGLLLFAGDHYSYTLVTRPRPEMPQGIASAEDLLEVWNPVTANAGTFEISGDTLTRRPMVAKSPNAMGAGIFNRYTFRMRGDTLWITTVGTETGPARNPTTVRYQRLR